MLFFRGWVTTTLVGLGGALLVASQRDRKKLFDDYCSAPAPSTILLERIKYHYGEDFALEARTPRPQVRETLYKKSTLAYWFDDPMNVLRRHTSIAAL
jgi:hypothetical protein